MTITAEVLTRITAALSEHTVTTDTVSVPRTYTDGGFTEVPAHDGTIWICACGESNRAAVMGGAYYSGSPEVHLADVARSAAIAR